MYVTAHRVRTRLLEGINAYLYAHGGSIWQAPPEPEIEPGELVNSMLTVAQVGGNEVRSFLDMVAPDGTWWSELRPRLLQFVDSNRRNSLPWRGVVHGCLFRLGMDRQLARTWQQELAHLYRACEMVHHAA
jgi:hypothetical protein